ncbi:helix-turn-helix domain-containing protein [Spirosoma luteum]|uniref:helix-turn-helix domain-containing protein n=1 Tax=Spirosoma luteum TaxID=431553 RepID=UPI000360342E|nr:AraC family transcriptional regulator [Spirosoma luteum]
MVNDYAIAPHAHLAHLVDQYVLSTSQGHNVTILGNWAASPETSLAFHLADQPQPIAANPDSQLYQKPNCLIGVLTQYNGQVNFQGIYHTFIIQFKANGFTSLLGIPASEVTNRVILGEDIWGARINEVQEQLSRVGNVRQMADLADSFLLSLLNRQPGKPVGYPAITALTHHIGSTQHWLTVDRYADLCNMSVRNFERRFSEQTGVAPKLYMRLVRFNEVVKAKLQQPTRSLTELAYAYGYYDQMHMIKEFKQFAQLSPTEFFCQATAITEQPVEQASYRSSASY